MVDHRVGRNLILLDLINSVLKNFAGAFLHHKVYRYEGGSLGNKVLFTLVRRKDPIVPLFRVIKGNLFRDKVVECALFSFEHFRDVFLYVALSLFVFFSRGEHGL